MISKDLSTLRIALFGGSFDPVHNGHLAIAQAALEQAALTKVLFLPAARSPLKDCGPIAEGPVRMEMLQAALQGKTWAAVIDWELNGPGPSYSWQTALYFVGMGPPGAQWFWLLGADQWAVLGRWNRWEYLAEMVTFLVFARDGFQPLPKPNVRAIFLRGEFAGSSTEIRTLPARNQNLETMVPRKVADIIRRENLYGF